MHRSSALQRMPMITGRLVDAQTGKGIAGVKLSRCWQKKTISIYSRRATNARQEDGTRSRRGPGRF